MNYSTSPTFLYPAPPTRRQCHTLKPLKSRSVVTFGCYCYILSIRFSLCILHLNEKQLGSALQ